CDRRAHATTATCRGARGRGAAARCVRRETGRGEGGKPREREVLEETATLQRWDTQEQRLLIPLHRRDRGSFDSRRFPLSRACFRLALRERGGTDREDRRKVFGDQRPGLALVGARPEISRRTTTKVDAGRIKAVRREPLAKDLELRTRQP